MSANPLRGEAALTLGADMATIRPSFARLVAAEAELGSLLTLVERAGVGDLRVTEMIALLWHCLDHDGWTRDGFCDAALTAGVVHLAPAVQALFRQILGGQ